MTARTRTARWTLPVLLALGAVVLAGCGPQPVQSASDGGGTPASGSTQPDEPGEEPAESPEEPTDAAAASPDPGSSAGTPADALLPAAEVPGFNDEFTWTEGATEPQEPQELAGTCHAFEMTSIGAEEVAYRSYSPGMPGEAKASELVAQFPDEATAARAYDVLTSWRKDCSKKLRKYEMADVRDLVDVPVDAGQGAWYLLVYGPVEADPEAAYFDAQGITLVGNRVAVLRLSVAGQDYNYEVGHEPMVAAVRAAAARL